MLLKKTLKKKLALCSTPEVLERLHDVGVLPFSVDRIDFFEKYLTFLILFLLFFFHSVRKFPYQHWAETRGPAESL